MLYTIIVLATGVYFGQEYQILPSVRILIANLMIYLRNLRDPIENVVQAHQNRPIYEQVYERIYGVFWW